jgi:hypothetical protein
VRRILFLALTLLSLCAASAWLAGCPATALIGLAPITAVEVPIATLLLDENLGCGCGPNEVYKYAVVVAYAESDKSLSADNCPGSGNKSAPDFLAGAVFDCFASATFGNLPPIEAGGLLMDSGAALEDGGTVAIWAWVAFYNYDTYMKLGKPKIDEAASHHGDICTLGATWTTTCLATEQDNIVAPFACPGGLVIGDHPPQPNAAVCDAATRDAPSSDAPTDAPAVETSSDGPTEATVEGGADAHIDAPPG